jgi:hypothetical protein
MSIVEKYREILSIVSSQLELDTTHYDEYDDDVVTEKCSHFHSILQNDDLFTLFLNQKIKVFSSKMVETNELSNSLFDEELSLKKILNNRTELVKSKLWNLLFEIYILLENEDSTRVSILTERINNTTKVLTEKLKTNMFKTDVNETTSGMIEDIVSSFQSSINNANENPMASLMDITTKITEKYQSKIENGEIEIDKLLGSLSSSMPGLSQMSSLSGMSQPKEPVVMDENFSTANVDVEEQKDESGGLNIGSLLNGASNLPDLGNLSSIVSDLSNAKSDDDVKNIKTQMDTMLNSMGVDVDALNKQMESITKNLGNKNK